MLSTKSGFVLLELFLQRRYM